MLLGVRDCKKRHPSTGGCPLDVSGAGKDPCHKSQGCDQPLVLYNKRGVKRQEHRAGVRKTKGYD